MVEKLKVVIVDDEQPAVDILSHFVDKVPSLKLKLATTNSIQAIDFLNSNVVDLVFLDIQMPDITGIEFVNVLEKKPMIVFTTAFTEYAIKGYDLDIVDYLLKPIRFSRFLQAVNKASNRFIVDNNGIQPKEIEQFLTIKVEYKTMRIAFDDINYIEGCKDYVKIFYADKMVLTRLNLKQVFEKLPKPNFVRIHRSFIVAFSKVSAFQKSKLEIGETIIPIGEQYRIDLIKRLES